jgi:hypothetical protein
MKNKNPINLDLAQLDKEISEEIVSEPIQRDPEFNNNIEVQTKIFEEKVDNIM